MQALLADVVGDIEEMQAMGGVCALEQAAHPLPVGRRDAHIVLPQFLIVRA